LETYVNDAFAASDGSVLLDLRAMSFIDSSGLRVLVALSNEARARGATLALRNVPRHAERVLDLTGLAAWFDRAPDA
jgi:anti-anti-sigma factor